MCAVTSMRTGQNSERGFRGAEGGFHLEDVRLRGTEENGHELVLLSNGSHGARVSGPLARLRVEEAARPQRPKGWSLA
jgi:hypothetical protein